MSYFHQDCILMRIKGKQARFGAYYYVFKYSLLSHMGVSFLGEADCAFCLVI